MAADDCELPSIFCRINKFDIIPFEEDIQVDFVIDTDVEWDTITYSGKKFWVVVGSKIDDEGLNNAKEGSVLPETNNELGIYYTVVRGR
ncbi:hypothetical protein LIT32_12420 [Bacillus sp. CMF21]|nr:hypothetical protein LIT32_12420 [Bacillus sp. CMF21]